MTDKATLLALAERAEALDGSDRELDGWIHAHMTRGERYIIGNEPGRFPQPPIYGERLDVMQQLTEEPEGAAQYIGAPHYTASLDAALTLVPEGDSFTVGQNVHHGHWVASVNYLNGDGAPQSRGCSNACRTGPLALCAAALRARAEVQS